MNPMKINYFAESTLEIHKSVEQLQRQSKLQEVTVKELDKLNNRGILGKSNYETTLFDCSCGDFRNRKLPCKHMYRLAYGLGLYKTTRNERTTNLIADFSSGFAAGWKIAVPSCFRSSLDILLMPRSTGEKDSDGKTIFKNVWTQGELYNFNQGAVFYNDKIAYEVSWADALKKITLLIQIENAIPSFSYTDISFDDGKIINNTKINYGALDLKLYKPKSTEFGIEVINNVTCFQDKFVQFLKTGILETSSSQVFDFSI